MQDSFLPTRSLATTTLAPLLVALCGLAACADAGPDRIDGGTTVRQQPADVPGDAPGETPGEQAGDESLEGPVGASFTDVPDLEGDLTSGDPLTLDGGGGLADQNPGLAPYLNPNLAAGLRADPGLTAEGTVEGLVTFGDLSLVGVNLDHLLDYIYKPETEGAKKFEFPDAVKEKAGKDRAVIGYMIPLEMKPRSNDIISFMLVRDLQACCFGGIPRPDEWVYVEMAEGKTTELFRYVPVTVRGEFTVGRLEDEYGYAIGVYNMTGESVEQYEPPTTSK